MSERDAEYLVFGFIEAIESILSNSIIQSSIKELCIRFYFINEGFGDYQMAI